MEELLHPLDSTSTHCVHIGETYSQPYSQQPASQLATRPADRHIRSWCLDNPYKLEATKMA